MGTRGGGLEALGGYVVMPYGHMGYSRIGGLVSCKGPESNAFPTPRIRV